MTLTIPPAFPDWLVTAVAGYFPECDEDAVRRDGDHWTTSAESCRKLAKQHDDAAAAERAALHGSTGDAKSTRNMQLGDDLRNQATYCDSMADQCYKKANEAEFTKLQVIGTGFALLAQLVVDALMSAPGVVKAAEDRAAAEASWTATARRHFAKIKKVGLECATKRKGIPLAKATVIGAVIGAGTAASVNLGAQLYQKEVLHHRDKVEWNMVEDAGIIGGVGGGIGARFASRVAPRINKFLGKVAGKSESNIVRYGAHVTAGVLIGGVGGAAGGAAGAGAQILVTGHIPNGAEMRDAVLHGFVGGFVGSATVFAHPLPPRVAPTKTESTTSSNSSNPATPTTPPGTTPPGTPPHPGTTPPGTPPLPTAPDGTPRATPPQLGTPPTTETPPGTTPPATTPPGTTPPATPPGTPPLPTAPDGTPRATPPQLGTPPTTPPGTTPPATPPGTTPPATPPATPPLPTAPDGTPRPTPPQLGTPPTTETPPGTTGPHSGATDPGSGDPASGKPAKPPTGEPATPERPVPPTEEPPRPDRGLPPREEQTPPAEETTPPPGRPQGEGDPADPHQPVPPHTGETESAHSDTHPDGPATKPEPHPAATNDHLRQDPTPSRDGHDPADARQRPAGDDKGPTRDGSRPNHDGTEPPGDGHRPTRDTQPDPREHEPSPAHDRETDGPHQDSSTDHTPDTHPSSDRPPSIDEAHARHGETTPAGLSHHRGDSTMGDLPHRVARDPDRFTADVHLTENGQARIGDHTYSPEEYGNLLRRNGWDGKTPIRLIGCDAATNHFAKRLAAHLGVDVLAPTKPAWTDNHGRLYTATAEPSPNGTRRPRIPPDGEWVTHHPDGTSTKASPDGFPPGTRETDKHGVTGDDAKARIAPPDEQPRIPYEDLAGDKPLKTIRPDDPDAPKRHKPFGRDKHDKPEKLDANTAYHVYDKGGRDRGLFITGDDGHVKEVLTDSGRAKTRNPDTRKLEGDGFNPDLKNPFPDTTYTVDERFRYTTDSDGRVVVAEGRLFLEGSDDSRRGPDQSPTGHVGENEYGAINKQTIEEFEKTFGREPTLGEVILFESVRFDGGHLFGTEFGGAGEAINMVPMLTSLNRDPGSTTPLDNWRKLEQHWEHILDRQPPPDLRVRISLTYDSHDPASKTPKYISVDVQIDGTLVEKQLRFKNLPHRTM